MNIQKISAFILAVAVSGILSVGSASASTWTDQPDYSPGSIVTISGDNSDGAGYITGETVNINVTAPYSTETGSAVVGDNGSFSWQLTLPADDSAIGNYSYTTTGQNSNVVQTGTFTDAPPPACSVVDPTPDSVTSPSLGTVDASWNAATAAVGGTFTYDVKYTDGTTTINHPGVISMTDSASGLADGTWTVTVKAVFSPTDPCSGSHSSSHVTIGSVTLVSDVTPPVIVPTVTPIPNGAGWNNTDVTVSWSVTDPESAVSSTSGCDTAVLTDETTGTTLTCSATSEGGTSSKSVTVKIDKTKPEITGSRSPEANKNGWNNTDVEVSFACADTGSVQSGIETDTVAGATASDENAGQSVTNTGSCVDMAGNEADSATVSDINIDKTAPDVTIVTPADSGKYTFKQTVLADWSASDALSGIDTAVGTVPSGDPIDTGSLGPKDFTVTATDLAGNSSEVAVSYDVVPYTFGGFGAPLTISTKDFKKMSTIPVKFQLFDTLGNPVSNAVATLTVNGTPAVSSGGSNIGNYFRYDPVAKQYIFNLSTKTLSLGLNTLKVALDDGTAHSWPVTIK